MNPSNDKNDCSKLVSRKLTPLEQITTDNAAGEYYLTDCPKVLLDTGEPVDAIACLDPSESLSVNTPEQLQAVAKAFQTMLR